MEVSVPSYLENYDLYWKISYVCAWLNLFFGPLGAFFNGMIALAIYRIKNYRKISHYLLIALALGDTFTSFIMVNQSFLVFSGYVLVTSGTCFRRMWYCHFMIYLKAIIFLGVGLDRLYAVTLPVKYFHSTKRWFLGGILISALVVAVTGVALGAISVDEETVVANCGSSNSLGGIGRAFFERVNLSLTGLAIVIYGLAYYKTKKRVANRIATPNCSNPSKTQIEADKWNHRLMTSLMLILAFTVLSRLFAFAFAAIVRRLPIDDRMMISAISMYSSMASLPDKYTNFFIFWFRSKEYREEFQKILHIKASNVSTVDSSKKNNGSEGSVPKQDVIRVSKVSKKSSLADEAVKGGDVAGKSAPGVNE